jgi:low density lipoprotein-related protein 2
MEVLIFLIFSESLHHPISLDVFESTMFWVTRDAGELVKQDKFGRGVPVVITKDLVNPSAVKGKKLL